MTPPVLSGGSPRRLYHYAGKWVLEVVRHVNLGPDLVRPRTERLSGQRAIASYFKNNPDKATLAKATQRLMQTDPGVEAQSFNLEGSEWIANSIPPPAPGAELEDNLRPPVEPPNVETEVAALKAQVVVLTAVQEGLIARLSRLEGRVALGPAPTSARVGRALAPAGRRTRAGAPAARATAARAGGVSETEADEPPGAGADERDEGAASEAADSSRTPSTREGAPPPSAAPSASDPSAASAPSSGETGGAPSPEVPLAPGPEAAAAAPAAPERALLVLPPAADLARSVALLIGGDLTVQGAPELAVNRTTKDCHAASLLDDREQTLGMVLLDLKAAVFLGGTLMMLPRAELDQQLQALSPGEDSIAAAAEICNAIAAVISEKGPQVRAGPLEKFEFKTWSWIRQPAERRDLEDSFGGRIVVAARPAPVQIF